MNESAVLTRYYCTAGSGMEPLLVRELQEKVAAEEVCQIPGKVLFSSSAGINTIRGLKSAERLFLLLKQDSPVTLPAHTRPAQAASVLQHRLLTDSRQWTDAVMTWSRLQREMESRGTEFNTASTAERPQMRMDRNDGGREVKEESGDRGRRKRSKELREEEIVEGAEAEGGSSRGTSEKQTPGKKRRRVVDEEESVEGERQEERGKLERCVEEEMNEESSSERKRGEGEEEERKSLTRGRAHGLRATEWVGVVEEDEDVGPVGRETTEAAADMCSRELIHSRTKMAAIERSMEPAAPPAPTFRISCRCSGVLARHFSTQELGRVVGSGLSRLLGWKSDLKNPQLEVSVYLSSDHSIVGIPVTRFPLAKRSYIKSPGLRSTVAWALGFLAGIQPGSRVLDPMCGAATILLEAAQEHKDTHFLGVDLDDGQLQRANENITFADLKERIQLLKASCTELPLASASVDAVICDVPFGRKFNTKTYMADNLPIIITEMERVLRVGGSLLLLLSPQLSCRLKKLQAADQGGGATRTQDTEPQPGPPPPLSTLKLRDTHRVSLGAIDGLIHSYVKIQT